ncbi:MAG: hypothetical protein HY928_17500 [Elusimicrobia bacterium]|nr:hypothetical protein [Elusimicrobiota bacterium]
MFAVFLVLAVLASLLWVLGPAKDERDFFTAGGDLPPWAAALWFAAAEASAMTLLGVSASAFREDWRYLQFFAGSAAARAFLAVVLLPAIRADAGATAYGWLEKRYGPGARRWAAGAFLAARLGVTGVRLMAACATLAALAGGTRAGWIGLVAVSAAGMAAWGGLRAVVFAGAAQALFLIAAGTAFALYAAAGVDGGVLEALRLADAGHRLDVWRWMPDGPFLLGIAFDRSWGPAALAGGFLGSLAAFAADQEMMQAALNAREGDGRRGLLGSVFASFALLVALLGLGAALYAFYEQHTAMALPDRAESILPHFAVQNMSLGWRALLVAALFAAVVDLPLVGSAAAFLADLRPGRVRLAGARWTVCAAAAACALAAWTFGALPWAAPWAARLGTPAYGPVLGLVLYGVFGPRSASRSALSGLALGTAVCAAAMVLEGIGLLPFGWHWMPLVGAGVTLSWAHRFGDDAVIPAS